jgi:FAD/FMN-containing dehydrogenase
VYATKNNISYILNQKDFMLNYDIGMDSDKYDKLINFTKELYGKRAKYIYSFGSSSRANMDMLHIYITLNNGYSVYETNEMCENKLLRWVENNGGKVFNSDKNMQKMKDCGDQIFLQNVRALKRAFDPKNILNPGWVWF